MKATGTQGLALSGTVQDQESVESGRVWTDVETFNKSFQFLDGKNFFIASLLVLNLDQVNKVC